MGSMGFFDSLFSSKRPEGARDVTFTLDQAGHTYEDGNIGLKPTSLTITPESKRVAVIGLNGSGKTTLLQLLDGALAATSGSVRIDADGVAYDPSVKRDLKRIESMIGRVRREEIPNSYYKADSIREAIDEPLKKHKVPESERQAIIGNLFGAFRFGCGRARVCFRVGQREAPSAGDCFRIELLSRSDRCRRAD